MSTFPQPGALVAAHPVIFKRLLRFSHMVGLTPSSLLKKTSGHDRSLNIIQDFEHAIWELATLLVLPRKV